MTNYAIRRVADGELIEATRLCFPALPRWSWQARQVIASAPEQLGVDFRRQMVARSADGIAASCLSVLMAGRAATVLAPCFGRNVDPADQDRLAVQLLQRSVDECRNEGAVLIQALLDRSTECRERQWFEAAGFRHLATLLYMECNVQQSPGDAEAGGQARADVQWSSYQADGEESIGRLIERTYVGTLDCPELEGRRTWRDVVDSHKGSGQFDPQGWQIAICNGERAGLALVNRVAGREACELVYMGVVPEFRGRGLGRLLVERAKRSAAELGCGLLTLAVDERNEPALRVYQEAGFRRVGLREAFCVPDVQ